MSERLFQSNLQRWTHQNPQAAVFLPYVDLEQLVVCKTEKGEPNLKRIIEGHEFYYHPQKGALQESQEWFSKLDLSETEVLCIYGVGLGYDYEAVKPWLKHHPKRRLIFLEDDLAVIRRLFETELGSRITRDRQVQLHFFDNLEDPNSPLSELYWGFMSINLKVSALRLYELYRVEQLSQLTHKIFYDATLHHSVIDEYLKYGIGFFRNFYLNMLILEGAYHGNSLFNKFRKVPAIVCGAGPSLNKNLHLLTDLSDKALIFAGGSAINALNAAGIQPHFGAGIDPNAEQYQRMHHNVAFEVPFLYRNRMFHDAFREVHGPRLYVTGSGGYDIARWYEEKFGIVDEVEPLDEGFNIVNFCLAIAEALGCNPIILVGMDLAYTHMEAYAGGVIAKTKVTKKEILETHDIDTAAILRQDIFGKPVYTMWKWIAESNWISDYAIHHPLTQFINSTEGGIGFPDVPNVPLQEVVDAHLSTNYDLYNRLQGEIQNGSMPQVTNEKLIEITQEMHDSLIRCQDHLDILTSEMQTIADKMKETKELPMTLQSGKEVLSEIELGEEPGYLYLLEIFNAVYSKVLNQELQQIQTSRSAEWRKAYKRLLLNIKRLNFLKDVAAANRALIQYSLKLHSEQEEK